MLAAAVAASSISAVGKQHHFDAGATLDRQVHGATFGNRSDARALLSVERADDLNVDDPARTCTWNAPALVSSMKIFM
jgi:hypothetical protein